MSPLGTSTLLSIWREAAQKFGDLPALRNTDGSVLATFAEVDGAAVVVGKALAAQGVAPGSIVLIDYPRTPSFLPCILGIWSAGATFLPALANEEEKADLVASVRCRFAILFDDAAELEPGHRPRLSCRLTRLGSGTALQPNTTEDHAYAMPTSGSTGRPKLALVTHRTAAAVMLGLARIIQLEPQERAFHTAAFSFSSSIRQLFLPLICGASIVIDDRAGPFSPHGFVEVVAAAGITSLDITPSHLSGLIRVLKTPGQQNLLRRLNRLLVASEVLSPDLAKRWRRVVGHSPHTLFHLYGKTETGGALSATPLSQECFDGVNSRLPLATPFPPFGAMFEQKDPSVPDEMLISGLDRQDGILTSSGLDRTSYEASAAGLNSLYRSSDLFERTPDDHLFYSGRTDQQLKVLGIRIDGYSVEQKVSALPGVEQCALVRQEREAEGASLIIAYVVRSAPGAIDSDVADVANRALPSKSPRVIAVRLDELPITTSGKVDRPALAKQLANMGKDRTADEVLKLWRNHTNELTNDEATDFFSAGGDSLSLIGLLADAFTIFGTNIDYEQFMKSPTLTTLRALLGGNINDRQGSPAGVASLTAGDEPFTPTPFQRGVWIGEKLAALTSSPYWLPLDWQVRTRLDQERLTEALRAVLRRHDALRLCFIENPDGELISHTDAVDVECAKVEAAKERFLPTGFGHLTKSRQLVRLGLSFDGESSYVSFRIHHAIADRSSLAIIPRELCEAYTNVECISPQHHFSSLAAFLSSARFAPTEEARQFWHKQFPPKEVMCAPHSKLAIARSRRTIGLDELSDFYRRTRLSGATRHAHWLRHFYASLKSASVPDAELIGLDIDIRPRAVPDLVGPYVSALPIVMNPAMLNKGGEASVMHETARLLAHSRIDLAGLFPPGWRPTGNPRQPYFKYKLVYQNQAYPELEMDKIPIAYVRLPGGIAENDISLYIREQTSECVLEVAWNEALLPPGTGDLILSQLLDALR
jgi:acyl-coenzyme A synthetase/AMP-(fatty) acid ligase